MIEILRGIGDWIVMATYQRFEDLPVWQAALRLAEGCEDFLLAAGGRIPAAVSIMGNALPPVSSSE